MHKKTKYNKMKHKKRKGVTLLELMVAVAILSMAVIPVMAMLVGSVRANMQSHRITIAIFIAQQAVEEFVGRTWEGDTGLSSHSWNTPLPEAAGNLGNFYVVSTYRRNTPSTPIAAPHPLHSTNLMEVTVHVYDSASPATRSLLARHSHIINIQPGGLTP